VNGTAPVGFATMAELEPAATPGTPAGAGGAVAAACAGAGLPAARPTDEEEPVVKATWGTVTAVWSSEVVVQPGAIDEACT